ncbi:MAG TPA: DUF6662 family protein [Candidatus Binatia bacterium]|jgi:hypothetical protein
MTYQLLLFRLVLVSLFWISTVFLSTDALAGESIFGFVFTTDTLPKGAKEVEQWSTWRRQKAGGQFDLLEGRTEFEYGITDSFQSAFYLNYAWSRAFHNAVDGTTAPPETFAGVRFGPDSHWHSGKFVGVSLEGVYRILSPYTDPLGLALYIEPTFGKGLFEVENRLIAQKNFLDDRLVIASNVSINLEGRRLPGDPEETGYASRTHWDHETDFNIGLASSYRFIANWSAGFEFLNEREYSNFSLNSHRRTNVAYYLGPVVHYGGERFFATATFITQLPWGQDFADAGVIKNGRNYADDFEKYRLRVKVGFTF